MPTETELKLRIVRPDEVRAQLRAAHGIDRGHVDEVNTLFDTPEGRLRAADCGLRVRQARRVGNDVSAGEIVTLTFKGPRATGGMKAREELETVVNDADMLGALLGRLGFSPVIVYEKRRETWQLGPCEVVVDELPQLGHFIELEGPDESAVAAVAHQLGLNVNEAVQKTYVELAAEHGVTDAAGVSRLLFD